MIAFIILSSVLFGFIWAGRIRKRQTKLITVFLALASLSQLDPFIGVAQFSVYLITVASMLAAAEPSNSINLRSHQKAFFIVSAIPFVLLTLLDLSQISLQVDKRYLASVYLLMAFAQLLYKRKKLRSRLGVIVIWAGIALSWLLA